MARTAPVVLAAFCLSLVLSGCPGPGPALDASMPADAALPAGACTAEQMCRGAGETCYAPGEPRPCGICRNPDPGEACSADSACKGSGATYICLTGPGACTCAGQGVCRPGCASDADCPGGTRCGADNRCAGKACTGSGACGGGFCVKGTCYTQPGACELPRP